MDTWEARKFLFGVEYSNMPSKRGNKGKAKKLIVPQWKENTTNIVWDDIHHGAYFLNPSKYFASRTGQPHGHHSPQKDTGQASLLLAGASRQYSLGGPPDTVFNRWHCPSGTVLVDLLVPTPRWQHRWEGPRFTLGEFRSHRNQYFFSQSHKHRLQDSPKGYVYI